MVNSQNGYSVLAGFDSCRIYKVDNVTFYLRPDDCGYVLAHFAKNFDSEVENLSPTDCHGFSRRKIAGSDDWSNHASATAVDLNATKHPSGRTGTFSSVSKENLRDLMENYDDVLRWGGDYRTIKDEMHVEINKTYSEVTLVAQRLRKNNTVSLAKLKPGLRNIDVYMVKRELKLRGHYTGTMNKFFGDSLKKAYASWQRSLGYTGSAADGVPGKSSLSRLGFVVTN